MKKHISEEFYNHIKKAKEFSNEFKHSAIALLKSCELVNIPAECIQDINNIMLVSDDLLDQYQKCMDYAVLHKKECADDNCKHYCDDILYSCKEAIKALGNVEIECDTDLKPCVDSVELAIEKTKECSSELDKFLENDI